MSNGHAKARPNQDHAGCAETDRPGRFATSRDNQTRTLDRPETELGRSEPGDT